MYFVSGCAQREIPINGLRSCAECSENVIFIYLRKLLCKNNVRRVIGVLLDFIFGIIYKSNQR